MIQMSVSTRARLIGLCILTAYGVLISQFTTSPNVVMIADTISGISVIAIAALLFPLIKPTHPNISIIYLLLKLLEGGLMILAGILYLFPSFQSYRAQIYESIHLYIFIISGFLFFWLLLKSKLVPKFLSIWGLIAITIMLINTLLKIVGYPIVLLDYLLILIISNEVFLALWLMFKGFSFTEKGGDNVNESKKS